MSSLTGCGAFVMSWDKGGGRMYPVSEAFLAAVQENVRKYFWTGRITTIDMRINTTRVTISPAFLLFDITHAPLRPYP